MPMIDVYATAGTFAGKHQLAAGLAFPSCLAGGLPASQVAELLAMARQAHARVTIIPGAPHLSMITDPGIVTQVILNAVHATT
jgi:pimeloyl-ACP methyl ester carboxylesterase